MIAYHYSDENIYDGEIERQLDPLETEKSGHDIYLMPANATDKKPPADKEGYYIFWTGDEWEYREIPKPEPPEPHIPTKEELLAELTMEYRQEKANLCEAYTTATMQGDTETAQSVAQDMADLDEWFDEEYKAIEEGSVE